MKKKKYKYRVVSWDGSECIMETNSYAKAEKCAHDYNECCGDWYVEENKDEDEED